MEQIRSGPVFFNGHVSQVPRLLNDSSVLIDYLRGDPKLDELETLMDDRQTWICGPVLAEISAGLKGSKRGEVMDLLAYQRFVDLTKSDWLAIGDLSNKLVIAGEVTPLSDVAIAVAATKVEATLWTRDRDFKKIKSVLKELSLKVA